VIVGVGIELVDRQRFESLLDRHGDRLRDRLFTAGEREYAARKKRDGESLAVRFAAKLAAKHALRASALCWRDIEVVRGRSGPPTLRLTGGAERAARRAGVSRIALTLTHDAQWCVGQVILESAR
jgi:holo-[acyl-carrier protein] synthase